MKQTLKATAVIAGFIAGAWALVKMLFAFMWLCYYAGIPM